jgi:CheY-like chemotaxis protein
MLGEIEFSLAEIERLAAHYGVQLADLLRPEPSDTALKPALADVDGFRVACRIAIGEPSDPSHPGALVAIQHSGDWLVVSALNRARTQEAYSIERVVIEPRPPADRKRVAVLDDTREVTESLCLYLRAVGFDSHAYYAFEDLAEKVASEPYDAYIIDWLIDGTTARKLIEQIRASDPACPIAVLTGKGRDGEADVDELAAVVAASNAEYFEKPAQTPMIAEKLKAMLGLRINAPL